MCSAMSRGDFLKSTGAVGAAGLLAACGGHRSSTASSADPSVPGPSDGDVSLSISWWGDDARHAAYQEAIAAFSEKHANITVTPSFAPWSGWEDTMSTKFADLVAEDVCQISWNWISKYSADAQTFLDLNRVADYIDFSQWDQDILNTCCLADAQQAVPVSMTGRIFYWNMTTFNKAGITEVPKTLDDLYAAGEAFRTQLGDDCYPLYLGGYDRMTLAVFYLESVYGKDWADPITSTLNYTTDEIIEGLDFIKSLVDNHVVMPLPTYYGRQGSLPAHQSTDWITGKLAGVFGWDSSAAVYRDALDADNRDGFTVGEEISFGGYKGGFTRVSMGLAITQTCKTPAEAAMLINFLLNEAAGASIMGSACGLPASKAGLAAAEAAGTVDPLIQEANSKIMAFCSFQQDPLFDDSTLESDGSGIYQDVFEIMDYDGVSGADVVDVLLDGMEAAGYTL